MRKLRIALWGMVVLLGGFLAWATLTWTVNGTTSMPSGFTVSGIGGPFTAQRADGGPITRDDMLGRPHMVFFGFTHCPDVCPTTLYEAGQLLDRLGPDGDKVDVYFVTVDPERDTAPLLADYLRAFDPRITGITGTPEQIADLAKQWRVFVRKGEVRDGEYNVDHTATTFLMTPEGDLASTVSYGENPDTALKKLRKLVQG